MGQRLQSGESKEARRPFDGMHGTEDVSQKLFVVRPSLKEGQAPLHAVKALLAFEKKFASQVVHSPVIGRLGENLNARATEAGGCGSWIVLN